jgi:hypothetical protein
MAPSHSQLHNSLGRYTPLIQVMAALEPQALAQLQQQVRAHVQHKPPHHHHRQHPQRGWALVAERWIGTNLIALPLLFFCTVFLCASVKPVRDWPDPDDLVSYMKPTLAVG